MANTNINIRTNSEIKSEAQKILEDLGLDMSTAFNLFLRQIINHRGIPFAITQSSRNRPQLGGWEDKINMPEDFDAPLEDFQDYMK